MTEPKYFIGIDGGGTKCKARLESADGKIFGEGLSGPANPVQGLQPALDSILDASHQAIASAGIPVSHINQCHAVLGLAGVNLPQYRQQIERWVHPFANCQVTTDLHVACLGAHDGQDGAVIIAGTGFNAGAVKQRVCSGFAGHGFILGDSASGARIGVEALRCSLEFLDGIRQESPLLQAIIARFGCRDANMIAQQAIDQSPDYYAQFAPLVFHYANLNDGTALNIVQAAAQFIGLVVRRLKQDNPARIALIGGIAESIIPWLDEPTRSSLSTALHPAEQGALLLARQRLTD